MNIVPNMISPNTTACRMRPVRVGQPCEAIAEPNTEDVRLYINGDATRRKMREDRTEIQALVDVVGEEAMALACVYCAVCIQLTQIKKTLTTSVRAVRRGHRRRGNVDTAAQQLSSSAAQQLSSSAAPHRFKDWRVLGRLAMP